MKSCLAILSDSLEKKIHVLKRIQTYNEIQEQAFQQAEPDLSSFDQALEEKEALIQEVLKLDQGFDTLYQSVKEQLNQNKEDYREEIAKLKAQITQITELSSAVQAKEARNKQLVESYFGKKRGQIKQSRMQAKVAYDYQRNMGKK